MHNVAHPPIPYGPTSTYSTMFLSILSSTCIVFKLLNKLYPRTAEGPDGLPHLFLKKAATCLVAPLEHLFSVLYANSLLSPSWLTVCYTIFQKCNPSGTCNYRSVSLMLICCKIKDELYNSLLSAGRMTPNQYTFISNHSTVKATYDWTLSLYSDIPVDIIYIDFIKAFDSVVHRKLLFKLSDVGLQKLLTDCISAFFTNKLRKILVDHALADPISLITGVPRDLY